MTYKEKYIADGHKLDVIGECKHCPECYGYEDASVCIPQVAGKISRCRWCWDRDMSEENEDESGDSVVADVNPIFDTTLSILKHATRLDIMADKQEKYPKGELPTESMFSDPVNHPSHYTTGDIECIDAIRASMSEVEFKGYLKGSVIKYMWRYDKKLKPVEDLKKASWYADKLIKECE